MCVFGPVAPLSFRAAATYVLIKVTQLLAAVRRWLQHTSDWRVCLLPPRPKTPTITVNCRSPFHVSFVKVPLGICSVPIVPPQGTRHALPCRASLSAQPQAPSSLRCLSVSFTRHSLGHRFIRPPLKTVRPVRHQPRPVRPSCLPRMFVCMVPYLDWPQPALLVHSGVLVPQLFDRPHLFSLVRTRTLRHAAWTWCYYPCTDLSQVQWMRV
ncbi:hypothetical protein OH77DRAFT_233875 [Trametes cingulata]|nr:hypothetical protein OH77DRAFT_233875 [Trametes cingulata]